MELRKTTPQHPSAPNCLQSEICDRAVPLSPMMRYNTVGTALILHDLKFFYNVLGALALRSLSVNNILFCTPTNLYVFEIIQ